MTDNFTQNHIQRNVESFDKYVGSPSNATFYVGWMLYEKLGECWVKSWGDVGWKVGEMSGEKLTYCQGGA